MFEISRYGAMAAQHSMQWIGRYAPFFELVLNEGILPFR
jgi:hypothetical protein